MDVNVKDVEKHMTKAMIGIYVKEHVAVVEKHKQNNMNGTGASVPVAVKNSRIANCMMWHDVLIMLTQAIKRCHFYKTKSY